MTRSNLRFNVSRSFVTMETNLPSCFSIQFLEQLLKFLVNLNLLKYVKSQRKAIELIFGFQILDLKDYFSASLSKILAYFSQFLPDLSLVMVVSRVHGYQFLKVFNFTWFLINF